MELIINTNRVMAALIKDSSARKIILSSKFRFVMPAFGKQEIEKYWDYIVAKTKSSGANLNKIFEYLLENIDLVYEDEISEGNMQRAIEIMAKIDPKDVQFIAAALERKIDKIWSDDPDFLQQKAIKVLMTKEMERLL